MFQIDFVILLTDKNPLSPAKVYNSQSVSFIFLELLELFDHHMKSSR